MKRSRARVPVGWAVGGLVLYLAAPTLRSLLFGVPLVVLGEGLRVWASGHIDKTRSLATGGPYAHTRNPLYLGSVIMAVGLAIASASLWVGLLAVVYLAAFYPHVIQEEAAFLRQKFPEQYAAWESAVPLFRPRVLPGGPRSSRFSWSLVKQNREWRTAAALPVVMGLFYLRGLLRSFPPFS